MSSDLFSGVCSLSHLVFHHFATNFAVGPCNTSTVDSAKYGRDVISSSDDLPIHSIFLGMGNELLTHARADEGEESRSTSFAAILNGSTLFA